MFSLCAAACPLASKDSLYSHFLAVCCAFSTGCNTNVTIFLSNFNFRVYSNAIMLHKGVLKISNMKINGTVRRIL